MQSFPLIEEFPPLVETHGWEWEPFKARTTQANFWIGTDRQGNRWLTKLRGAFLAYREIVFARLAQKMKWSCQTSVFMKVDDRSAQILGIAAGEVHAAHWFLDEHLHLPCSHDCEFKHLINKTIRSPEDLAGINISHLMDWPKSGIAACLFGAHEESQPLITKAHELVIIDSEYMFSPGPCSFEEVTWVKDSAGRLSPRGSALVLEVCQSLVSLSAAEIDASLQIPANILVQETWPIAPILHASRRLADEYVRNNAINKV